MPDMKKLVIGNDEFKIVDSDAQDHLTTHDQQIEEILNHNVVNKNLLINSDFICNTFDDADLNKLGWSFDATSEIKPQLVHGVGLIITPNVIGAEFVTPIWHPANSGVSGIPSIDFPITVSVEYVYSTISPDNLKVASVTYSNESRTSELVNIVELEEGKYLQIKLTNTGTVNVSRSVFTISDQLTKQVCIRRIKIERSEMATGFDQAMNDLSLLRVVKGMIDDLTYHKGQTVNAVGTYAGYITQQGKSIRFLIPLDKPIDADVTGVTLTGDFILYGISASEIITNNPSVGSWSISVYPKGIMCQFNTVNAISTPSGIGVTVIFSGVGKSITFS